MVRSLVNNELRGIWKVAVLSYFGVPPRHMSDRRRRGGGAGEIIASFRTEISSGDLRNTTQKCCPLNNGVRKYVGSEHNYFEWQLALEYFSCKVHICRDKWVPVTTAWRVLRLQMEERPPVWRVAAIILNNRGNQQGVILQLGGWARCWQLLSVKNGIITHRGHLSRTWIDTLVRNKKRKRDMIWTGPSWLRIGTGGGHLWKL